MKYLCRIFLILFLVFLIKTNNIFAQIGSSCSNPHIINALPFIETDLTTENSGNDFDNTMPCGSNGFLNGEDYVFRYMPSSTQIVEISLTNTGQGVGLFVFDNCPSQTGANCLNSIEATGGNPTLSDVTFVGGAIYYIVISTNDFFGFNPNTPFDISITEQAQSDVGIVNMENPSSGCGLSEEPVTVDIVNYGLNTVMSLQVAYTIDGGSPVTETVSQIIFPTDTITFTFLNSPDFSNIGNYELAVYTIDQNDEDNSNDTVYRTIIHKETITNLPYIDGFENGNNGWEAKGSGSSWAMGTPTAPIINTTASGLNCWATNLEGNHNSGENSYLESPCFDLSSMVMPIISLDIWYETEGGFTDGLANIEFSVDNGDSWETVGDAESGTNWYNSAGGFGTGAGWSGSSGQWLTASTVLSNMGGLPQVIFRIKYASGIGGTGEGFAFDNFQIYESPSKDVGIVEVVSPTGTCGLSSQETVTVKIANFGIAAQSGFDCAIKLNNNAPIINTYNSSINPGDTILWTFPTTIDISAYQTHELTAYTLLNGDANLLNDTAYHSLLHRYEIASMPYSENFETNEGYWTPSGNNYSWEYGTPSDSTTINMAASGNNCWVTNLSGNHNSNETSYLISPCIDFSALNMPIFECKIWYETDGDITDGSGRLEASLDEGSTWFTISENDNALNWSWSGSSGGWITAKNTLDTLAGKNNVLLRFRLSSPLTGTTEGFAIDDINIKESPATDLGVIAINNLESDCGLSNSQQIKVDIVNFGIQAQSNFYAVYQINLGTPNIEQITSTIQPGDTMHYTFNNSGNLSNFGNYNIDCYTYTQNDENVNNDTTGISIINQPIINNYPYTESFENDNAYWYSDNENNTWEHGIPNATIINSASNGNNVWATNLTGNHLMNENSYLNTGCYDMASLLLPVVELSLWYETSAIIGNGAAKIEYSIDGGNTWELLGSDSTGINWYNGTSGWNGNSDGWITAKHNFPDLAGETNVKFRINYAGSFSGTNEGIAIDNFKIYDLPQNDIGITEIIAPVSNCEIGDSAAVTVKVTNLGINPQSNFNIGYYVEGQNPVSENIINSVATNDTMIYTFNQKMAIDTTKIFHVTAYSQLSNDEQLSNDTSTYSFINRPFVTVFPYFENFEIGNNGWYSNGALSTWELSTPTATNINDAYSGQNAFVTNATGMHNSNENSYIESPCYDFTGLQKPNIQFKLNYDLPDGGYAYLAVSIDGGNDWLPVYEAINDENWYGNNSAWEGNSNGWINAKHKFDTLGGKSLVKFRLYFTASNNEIKEGIAIDDIEIFESALYDIGVAELLTPVNDCGLSDSETISINITNYGLENIDSIPIFYSIDSGQTYIEDTIIQTIIAEGNTIFTFQTPADLSATGIYPVYIITALANDENHENDSLYTEIIHIPTYNAANYENDFESGNDYWYAGGTNSTWELGIPNNTTIDHAASGDNAFVTNLTGNSANSEGSYVVSPCFNFSSVVLPFIELDVWYETQGFLDGAKLEATVDGGNTWFEIGEAGEGENWYVSGDGWTGSSQEWLHAKHNLDTLVGYSSVKLRIMYNSAMLGNAEGFAFDNIHIYQPENTDLKLVDIYAPSSDCGLSNQEEVIVEIKNVGLDTVYSYNVSFVIDGITDTITETIDSAMTYNQAMIYTFDTLIDVSGYVDYTMNAWLTVNDDENQTNDSIINYTFSNFHHDFDAEAYIMDFETTDNMDNWTNENTNNDGKFWKINNTAGLGGGGAMCYSPHLFNNADDYLYSRCFALEADAKYRVSFIYKTSDQSNHENISLFLLDAQNSQNIVDTLMILDNFKNDDYQYALTSIDVENSGTYYLGWYIHSNGGQGTVCIDHITISQVGVLSVTLPSDTCLYEIDTLTITANTQADNYLWSTNSSNQSIDIYYNENSINYWVEIQKDNLIAYDEITVSSCVVDTFDVDLGNDTCLYIGNTLTLDPNVDGNYSFNWSTGEETETIVISYSDSPETYWVEVTDNQSLLTIYDEITISPCSVDTFEVNLGADTCLNPNQSVILSPDVYGNYTYEWSTGSNASFIIAYFSETDSTYWVNVTDNVTSLTVSDTITISRCPIDSFNYDLGATTCLLEGDSILLETLIGPYHYDWSTGDSTSSIWAYYIDSTITYTVTVTDTVTLYAVTDSITISPCQTFTFDLGDDFCLNPGYGSNLYPDLGSGPYIYNWSNGDTTPNTWVFYSPIVETYWLSVTDTLSGLSVTDTLRVFPCDIDSFAVYIGDDFCLNEGSATMLNAGLPDSTYSFLWSTGDTTQSTWIYYLPNIKDYWVAVTHRINHLTVYDTIRVSPCNIDTFIVDLGNDTCVEDGFAKLLDPGLSGTYKYLWSTGSTDSIIWAYYSNDIETYWVKVTDTLSGLQLMDYITLWPCDMDTLSVDLGNDTCLNQGESILLDAGSGPYTYDWSTGATTQTIMVGYASSSHVYFVNVTDTLTGETAYDDIIISACDVGIYDENIANMVSYYPNPTSGLVYFNFKTTETFNLTIYGIDGVQIHTEKIHVDKDTPYQLNLENYAKGLYFVHLTSNLYTKTLRIIKQ